MEKEFVTYQIALELKELGFDEPCFGKYDIYGVFDHKLFYHNHDADTVLNCSAPTFSQCFRWFREKHTLYHNIKMFGDWDNPQFSYIVSGRTMNNPAHMWHYEDKNSYEEAELACLIKLIQIIKDGNK